MINGIEGLGEVQEDTEKMWMIIYSVRGFIYKFQKSVNGAVFLSKPKLRVSEGVNILWVPTSDHFLVTTLLIFIKLINNHIFMLIMYAQLFYIHHIINNHILYKFCTVTSLSVFMIRRLYLHIYQFLQACAIKPANRIHYLRCFVGLETAVFSEKSSCKNAVL